MDTVDNLQSLLEVAKTTAEELQKKLDKRQKELIKLSTLHNKTKVRLQTSIDNDLELEQEKIYIINDAKEKIKKLEKPTEKSDILYNIYRALCYDESCETPKGGFTGTDTFIPTDKFEFEELANCMQWSEDQTEQFKKTYESSRRELNKKSKFNTSASRSVPSFINRLCDREILLEEVKRNPLLKQYKKEKKDSSKLTTLINKTEHELSLIRSDIKVLSKEKAQIEDASQKQTVRLKGNIKNLQIDIERNKAKVESLECAIFSAKDDSQDVEAAIALSETKTAVTLYNNAIDKLMHLAKKFNPLHIEKNASITEQLICYKDHLKSLKPVEKQIGTVNDHLLSIEKSWIDNNNTFMRITHNIQKEQLKELKDLFLKCKSKEENVIPYTTGQIIIAKQQIERIQKEIENAGGKELDPRKAQILAEQARKALAIASQKATAFQQEVLKQQTTLTEENVKDFAPHLAKKLINSDSLQALMKRREIMIRFIGGDERVIGGHFGMAHTRHFDDKRERFKKRFKEADEYSPNEYKTRKEIRIAYLTNLLRPALKDFVATGVTERLFDIIEQGIKTYPAKNLPTNSKTFSLQKLLFQLKKAVKSVTEGRVIEDEIDNEDENMDDNFNRAEES